MQPLIEKLPAFLTSKRFWAAVGGVVSVVLIDSGLDETQVNEVITKILAVAGILSSWIIGDSLRSTMQSRRLKLESYYDDDEF